MTIVPLRAACSKSLALLLSVPVLAVGLMVSPVVHSSVIGTLVYTDPVGTVGANDTIDIRVALRLDAGSDPLTFNSADSFPNGVNSADIPVEGFDYQNNSWAPFDSYSYIGAFTSRSCDDTFTVSCSSPGSQYTYSTPSANSWFDFSGTINPGESRDFILYTLTPVNGGAAPGIYQLFTAGLGLTVSGKDANGNDLEADFYDFQTDCGNANCTFTRSVVPVPAAIWLFGGALGMLGAARRRLPG